jgi:hypothetical protein
MPKGYGYGGESTMDKKGALPKMKGQHGMMMKDQGQPMMKHGKGPEMSAELKYNAIDDITQGKGKGDFPFTHKHTSNSASMMVDKSMANMNHKGGMPMHGPLHEGHKGSAMPMYGPAKMYGKKK